MDMDKYFNEIDSIFENMTDDEFEQTLKECGFKYTKVNKGEGGLVIDDKERKGE
jgi:hypothetical protein